MQSRIPSPAPRIRTIFPPWLTLAFCLASPLAAADGAPSPSTITVGVEQSLGDVLAYSRTGFTYIAKPYLNWDIAGSGFVLAFAVGIPIAPVPTWVQPEVVEEYTFPKSKNATFEFSLGNNNSLKPGTPALAGGFIYGLATRDLFGLTLKIPYLTDGVWGLTGFSLAPAVTLTAGRWSFGFKAKVSFGFSGTSAVGLEPLISIDYGL